MTKTVFQPAIKKAPKTILISEILEKATTESTNILINNGEEANFEMVRAFLWVADFVRGMIGNLPDSKFGSFEIEDGEDFVEACVASNLFADSEEAELFESTHYNNLKHISALVNR